MNFTADLFPEFTYVIYNGDGIRVYCKNKNYGLSTFCLDSDQVAYKSKNTGYYLKYIITKF